MAFEGFRPAARAFFEDLRRHNSTAWFDAHREQWVELVRTPLEALLAEAEPSWGPGRVMRINRDVRFSADKSPYRTSVGMWAGTVGGVYLSVSAAGLEVGGGLYEPTRDQLARAREVIDRRTGATRQLQGIVDDLVHAGYELAGPTLTTAPRGYPRDHPRIELLRLRHYAALRHLPLTAAPARVHDAWQPVEPLNAWVSRHVGPAERWP